MDEITSSLIRIVGYQLFGRECPKADMDVPGILKEARAQTVFSMVFSFFQDRSGADVRELAAAQEEFFRSIILNTNNFQEHHELNEIMGSHDIPYTAVKGLSSAYYYPDPSLRDMGDVDFLVYEKDFERAKQAVLSAGFEIDHGDKPDSIHIAFKREPMSIWEQHRSVNGIPDGRIGELIQSDIETTIETAQLIDLDGAECKIPDPYHHGLVILLHMISHMTSEGIGLRHLCDWAVFADRLDNDRFVSLFKVRLERFGLWKYAQIMTAAAEKYLGMKHKQWAENALIDDDLLQDVIEDILGGGNFGKKDLNRYRETKYISNRGERTVDDKNIVIQVLGTLSKKTYADYPFIEKHRALLPIGWIAEGGKYVGYLISGERKSEGTTAMLKEAAKRKDIYHKMELFKTE